MDYPEKLSIKNGQSRETGNIWYTKLETQTNKAKKQKQDSTLYVLDTTILYIIGIRWDTFRLFLLIQQITNNKSTMNNTTSGQDYPVVVIWNLGTNNLAN